MSENLKLDMTVDEALAFAEEWTRGMTLHAGLQGWRVVCLLLGEEVRALREDSAKAWAAVRSSNQVSIDERKLQARINELESQIAELRQGGEVVAYVRADEVILAKHWRGGPAGPDGWEPLYTRPQPAIPPGYVVVPLIPTRAMEDVVNQDEWQWEDLLAAAEAITEEQYNEITAQSVLVAEKWQPIETAPKDDDGTEFLGFDGNVVDKTWVGWEEDGKPVYVHADYTRWKPTHWMPLPATPADSKEGE